MSNDDRVPELKEIVGAMVLAARRPVSVSEILSCFKTTADIHAGCASSFAGVREADVIEALAKLRQEVSDSRTGLNLVEIAGGYRFQTTDSAGLWVKTLLNVNLRHRLSHPALETLAIIAYRQPLTRADIEAIRGVNVDHIIRALMEMQLVRISGRSKLPGRPILYGTTKLFLEHFGLNSLAELPGIEQLSRIDRSRTPARAPGMAAVAPSGPDAGTAPDEPGAAGAGDSAPAAGGIESETAGDGESRNDGKTEEQQA